jgi:transketolase
MSQSSSEPVRSLPTDLPPAVGPEALDHRDLDDLAVDTLRFLAVDTVEKANSGHPGAPMGQAALAYALWTGALRFDPSDPQWPDRDRFVLSCGHASALLYGLLHLAGFELPLAELQRFRQLGSRTPGHPEHGLTPGVETTTGPLGQGFGNAVGMAMAGRMLAARYRLDDAPLFDHRIFVLASDGDLMEGVAAEAASLAGHLGLGNLVVFWDDNRISIDGATELSFSEDVTARFVAYGWRTLRVEDGHDLAALRRAIADATAPGDRPTLVAVRTHIGHGSPRKQDTADAHGSPLGAAEVAATKRLLGWPLEPTFLVPERARAPFAEAAERGRAARRAWEARLAAFRAAAPAAAAELDAVLAGALPADLAALPEFSPGTAPIATRAASGKVLAAVVPRLPGLVGGSADLTPSNNTHVAGMGDFSRHQPTGRYLRFGVREHAMGAIANGLALSGLRPYVATFLVFSDYMRPAIRLAAMMELPIVYVFTHDSIFLGEDGPTHQPESHLASLRAIPGLVVVRPADARETAGAWQLALGRRGPTALVLSRQNLPVLATTSPTAVGEGGYVVHEPASSPQLVLVATGSEVATAVAAAERLAADGIAARVLSMPSLELWRARPAAVRAGMLPAGIPRVAIEASSPFGWGEIVGEQGLVIGCSSWGASAPAGALAHHFGFTPEQVAARVRAFLQA